MMIKLEFERDAAQELLELLERRLEVIQQLVAVSQHEISEFIKHERETLVTGDYHPRGGAKAAAPPIGLIRGVG